MKLLPKRLSNPESGQAERLTKDSERLTNDILVTLFPLRDPLLSPLANLFKSLQLSHSIRTTFPRLIPRLRYCVAVIPITLQEKRTLTTTMAPVTNGKVEKSSKTHSKVVRRSIWDLVSVSSQKYRSLSALDQLDIPLPSTLPGPI